MATVIQQGQASGARRLAIMAYHKVGESPDRAWTTWNYVAESIFLDHLAYLRDSGWQVLDIATVLHGLAEPEILPPRAALLTFDDGYRSVRQVTLPALRRFGFPGVVFVPIGFIGGRNTFDAGIEPEEAMCDWEDLWELERNGVAVESHGVTHRRFSELSPPEQIAELVGSKAVLEAGLGRRVALFAFPYGDGGRSCAAMRERLAVAGYEAACLYGGGLNRVPTPDRYRLERLAVGADSDLEAMLEP
jgi:peptidoglycan/xylan/chitin deacetylase (PgdA/CDA1 family)